MDQKQEQIFIKLYLLKYKTFAESPEMNLDRHCYWYNDK